MREGKAPEAAIKQHHTRKLVRRDHPIAHDAIDSYSFPLMIAQIKVIWQAHRRDSTVVSASR